MIGWVCSYRTIWAHPFFNGNGMRVAVWHWLLHHAAWRETGHTIAGVKITLQRGEVCFSQQQIQDDTGATRKQVRDVLEWLICNGKASKIRANDRANGGASVRANARTILRIEKYDEYQDQKGEGANDGAKSRATNGPTKEQYNNKTNTSSNEEEQASPVPISVLTKAVWDCGVQYLTSKGIEDRQARSVLGKWRKDSRDAQILEAIEAAQRAGTEDPIPYITKTLKGDESFDVMAALEKLRKERA